MGNTPKKASEVQAGVYTLEQYAERFKVNPGTVASFKYEHKKAGKDFEPRTAEEWGKALEAQSKKKY